MPTKVSEHTPVTKEMVKDLEIAGAAGSAERPSFRIETHGCKLNMADSQVLAGQFMARGFRASNDGEEPGVYVVNSCTVTSAADKKARQAISSARRRFPGAIVVAAGCYPERDRSALEVLESVDLVYGNRDKGEIVDVVSGIFGLQSGELADRGLNSADAPRSLGRSRAAVKIQEGCDQVCAYCIVPRVRGREKSVPPDEIVRRTDALARSGCPEVVLTGTQLGTYGFDIPGISLRDLFVQVLARTGVRRLRVSSLQPQEVDDGLLDVWRRHGAERLAPHFHMPLQSGSDAVLARMRRRYTFGRVRTGRIEDTTSRAGRLDHDGCHLWVSGRDGGGPRGDACGHAACGVRGRPRVPIFVPSGHQRGALRRPRGCADEDEACG